MKKRIATLLMMAGGCCLAAAMLLQIHNTQQSRHVEVVSAQQLQLLDAAMEHRQSENTSALESSAPAERPACGKQKLKTVEIDGLDYIGKLQIPALDMELPVLSDWDGGGLNVAPCRYSGDRDTENLVLMAHNYLAHFGRIGELAQGDEVYFWDVDQKCSAYEVAALEILLPDQQEEMCAGSYPMTLFTCTYGGQNRIAVRLIEKEMK